MPKYHVACGPLTNRILAGVVNKAGTAFINKTDVTGAACGAVVEHVLANGGPVDVSVNGVPTYRILVEDMRDPKFPRVVPVDEKAFDALAYQILALALNNGTREAFPGKLKKLLEENANAQT